MAKARTTRFGGQPPRYGFVLNPYPGERMARCPYCEQKTGQRKLPLLIHVDPHHLIALNYTCRYCRGCDLLIANRPDIEHLLAELFRQHAPDAIGNDYLIIGTVEKTVWREGLTRPQAIAELLPHASDFARYYAELRLTRPGYYRAEEKPPIMEPPASREWTRLGG